MLKVRNKAVLHELLQFGSDFEKIVIAEQLDQDEDTKTIVSLASSRSIPVEYIPRKKMPKGRSGEHHEALVGYLIPQQNLTLSDLLSKLQHEGKKPFFLLINKVHFANNIGVIIRTGLAAGVNGIIFQTAKDNFYNEDTLHYSMGSIARLPIVKLNIFEAIKELQKNNVKTFALHMQGQTYYECDLTGGAAFVFGGERDGISQEIIDSCDKTLSIPMNNDVESLNVSASASIVLYEKVRQDLYFSASHGVINWK